jgi:hypothetical protein
MKEVWRMIEDFDAYAVSNLGRVKRIKKSAGAVVGRVLRTSTDGWGYSQLTLVKDAKHYTRKIHILVANAFIPNPLNLREINHKGLKSDNRAHRLSRLSTKEHALDITKRRQRGDGVFFDKERNTFRSHIPNSEKPGKRIYLGVFDTYEEASEARKEALL